MQGRALLDALIDVARDVDIEVRVAPSPRVDEPLPVSGVCRLRGDVWVILAPGDPVDAQISAVAAALRDHAADRLEDRWLPPAIRARVSANA